MCAGVNGLKVEVFCKYDGVFVCLCVLLLVFARESVFEETKCYQIMLFRYLRLQRMLSLTAVVPAVKICVHLPASIHTHTLRKMQT